MEFFYKLDGPLRVLIAATYLVAVFFIGYNPYVINTTRNGRPFYPGAGSKGINVYSNKRIRPLVWWLRYVPQLWMIPIIAAALSLYAPRKKRMQPSPGRYLANGCPTS